MTQAALTPKSQTPRSSGISRPKLRLCQDPDRSPGPSPSDLTSSSELTSQGTPLKPQSSGSARNGDLPITVPAAKPELAPKFANDDKARLKKTKILRGLQARIAKLENKPVQFRAHDDVGGQASAPSDQTQQARGLDSHPLVQPLVQPWTQPWTLGVDAIDRWLGAKGLDAGGVHEIKPQTAQTHYLAAAAAAHAAGFALRLLQRRLVVLRARHTTRRQFPILWCTSPGAISEFGMLYAPALSAMGFDPSDFIFVETVRDGDGLWALEEALKSRAVAAVVGHVGGVALTPARRLSLAAEAHATPCLLMTLASAPVVPATASRWRIAGHGAASNPFDAMTPAAPRMSLHLERCRAGLKQAAPTTPFTVEWSNETHGFRLASSVEPRTSATRTSPVRAA